MLPLAKCNLRREREEEEEDEDATPSKQCVLQKHSTTEGRGQQSMANRGG